MTASSGKAFWRDWRFAQLLVFTVAALVLTGLELRLAALIGQLVILNGVLVAGSMTDRRLRRLRHLLIGSWVVNVVLQLGLFAPRGSSFALLPDAASAAMLVLLTAVTLGYVLQTGEVTADTLFGAVVAYLFIGLMFARIFELIQTAHPGSFGPSEAAYTPIQLWYFSMVTLATLGYGDILPRGPLTQVLAVLEAVVGQFYVAVLVAWLVSAYARDSAGGRS